MGRAGPVARFLTRSSRASRPRVLPATAEAAYVAIINNANFSVKEMREILFNAKTGSPASAAVLGNAADLT